MDKSHPMMPPCINIHLLLDRATLQKEESSLLTICPLCSQAHGDELAVYFEPGGLAELKVRSSIVRAENVMLALGPVGRGTAHHPNYGIIGDGLGKGYSQDGDDENSFGHEAIGTSPLVSDKSIPGGCGHDSALVNVTQESTPPQAHHVCHSQPLEVDGTNVLQPV
jgi:hypothetical protein